MLSYLGESRKEFMEMLYEQYPHFSIHKNVCFKKI